MMAPHAALRAALLALCLMGPAAAQSSSDAAGIHDVINRQLEAFRRDDGPAAFAFASPELQTQFGTPERFLDLVRRAYAPVYRPRQAEFGALAPRNGVLVQEVELVGPGGESVLALYSMEPDGAGGWRISACVLVPSARVGA